MSLVLWSGGCDSTLILHRLAKKASKENPVRALTVEHNRVGALNEQRAARRKILAWMKRKGFPYVKAFTIRMIIPKGFESEQNGGLPQPII